MPVCKIRTLFLKSFPLCALCEARGYSIIKMNNIFERKTYFMKNRKIKGMALLLAMIMSVSIFATACTSGGEEESTDSSASSSESTSVTESENNTEKTPSDDEESSEESEAKTEESSAPEVTEKETDKKDPEEEETEDTRFEKDYAPVLYFSPEEIAKIAKKYEWGEKGDNSFSSNMLGGFLSEDKSYVKLIPFDGEIEACFYLFKGYKKAAPIMVVKYKTVTPDFYMEFFMNSVDDSAQSGSKVAITGLRTDGEWDLKMVNVKSKIPTMFNGESLTHIRFDFANGNPIPADCELDIAYIAFFNTVEDAYKFEYGENYEAPGVGGGDDEDEDKGYIDADDIVSAINNNSVKNVGSYILAEDGSYVTINAKVGGANDAYINLLSSPIEAGEFFAFKYRTRNSGYWVEFFMDSVNDGATGGSNFSFYPETDGGWKIYVIRVNDKLSEQLFDGKTVKYIRFDFANCNDTLKAWSIDVAGLGFFASEEEAIEALGGTDNGGDATDNTPAFIMDAEYIADRISTQKVVNIENTTVGGNGEYITINPTDGIEEAYSYMFTTETTAARYLVIKYRTSSPLFYMQMYFNSIEYSAGNGSVSIDGIEADGEWKTAIFDLESVLGVGRFNGTSLKHFRIDFINMKGGNKTDSTTSMDVAYIAFFTSLEAANSYAAE